MVDIIKGAEKEEKKLFKFFHKKENIWMIVSVVLAIILIASMVFPKGMSGDNAGKTLLNFLNTKVVPTGGVTLNNVTDKGSLYEVSVSYKGQDIPVFITKDGKYFIQGATEINPALIPANTGTPAATEVPKSAKPVVQAFVFAYCPYGLQFEKALSPVYTLLKNKADINVVFIGAMHGEFEHVESLRQLCIQKLYGKDMLWSYLNKFAVNTAIGNCNGDATCLDPLLSQIFTLTGIDKTRVNSCMTSDAPALYDADGQAAAALGISGSPTFVINGVEVSVDRTAESIKTAICNAFTDASKPTECSQTLSTTAATPSFGSGASTSSASSAASCG